MSVRRVNQAAFWVPILGAIAWSYPHLVAWFQPWAPIGWKPAAHGAALMLDALILAALFARSSLPHEEKPAALDHALWAGVALSVYVNLRYGLDQRQLVPWARGLASGADLLIGSAIAPAMAMLGHRALDAVLRALPVAKPRKLAEARVLPGSKTVPGGDVQWSAPEPAPVPGNADVLPDRPQRRRTSPEEAVRRYLALAAEYGDDIAAIMKATGKSRKTVLRWQELAGS